MPSDQSPTLEGWLMTASHAEVPAEWVPGLNLSERKALGAVGGLARSVLSGEQVAELPRQVQDWMSAAPSPPAAPVAEFRAALEADPDVALAALYSTVVRREHRRALGTFFTPSAEVKLMLDLWSDTEGSSPTTVIDVGAGVGVFTAEAAAKWPEAHIVAVDINPVTLGLLAVRLLSAPAASPSGRVELVREDFTKWIVSDASPASGGRLILGNPPYTRAQLMSPEERTRLHELTDGLCGSRASLSTIITALTLQQLGPTDGLSLLLPAQWLESQYARDLRKKMWGMGRRRVELRLVESEDLFGGAQVDAVALLVGAESDTAQPFRVAHWRGAGPVELDRSKEVPDSWRSIFDSSAPQPPPTSQVRLSDVAEVHRGVATGSNSTFVLSAADAKGIPKNARTRVITRLANIVEDPDEATLTATTDRSVGWLLTMTEDLVAKHAFLAELVRGAEGAKVHEGVLCSRRTIWYDLTAEVQRPDVIVGAMTQRHFKLVTNSINAAITNNLYGITWRDSVAPGQRRAILGWLRSDAGQTALVGVARRQGAGLLKLEPGGLRRLLLPDNLIGDLTTPPTGRRRVARSTAN